MNQRKTERKGRVHSTISNKLTIHNCEEQWMCIKYGSGDMIEIISFSLIGVLFSAMEYISSCFITCFFLHLIALIFIAPIITS